MAAMQLRQDPLEAAHYHHALCSRSPHIRHRKLRRKAAGKKVKDLEFFVQWLGQPATAASWEIWAHVKRDCAESMSQLAFEWGLPADIFERGSNLLPEFRRGPDTAELPPPPATRFSAVDCADCTDIQARKLRIDASCG